MNPLLATIPAPKARRPHSDLTDQHLMELVQDRVERGLDLLHDRYANLLKGVTMKVLHNDADAEDLLQDVFVEIWERAGSYDPLKGQPLSWIATLTRRRAIDRLRRQTAYCRCEVRYAEELKGGSQHWSHVHEDLSDGERTVQLQRAMATLPEAQRHAIQLAYHGQMTQREIAAFTGISLGTIKTRLELGIRKMAMSLQGYEDLLQPGRPAAADKKKRLIRTAKRGASAISMR
jgi:RNA polymerase sigma-70 factor, ECF subfamily